MFLYSILYFVIQSDTPFKIIKFFESSAHFGFEFKWALFIREKFRFAYSVHQIIYSDVSNMLFRSRSTMKCAFW